MTTRVHHAGEVEIEQGLGIILQGISLMPETIRTIGHKMLIKDLQELLERAFIGDFHDFATDLEFPKGTLIQELHKIIERVKQGTYDN